MEARVRLVWGCAELTRANLGADACALRRQQHAVRTLKFWPWQLKHATDFTVTDRFGYHMHGMQEGEEERKNSNWLHTSYSYVLSKS